MQADTDKVSKIMQRKALKGTHLPDTVKEAQTGCLISPQPKYICLYLAQNKLPHTTVPIRKVETLAERYVLLDSFLFKLITPPEKETALLAIPEIFTDKMISLYHSSLFA